MLNIFRGQRPDVTPAQVAAVLVAGVPAIATLLSAFGIADLTQDQQDALSQVLTWSAVLAGLLIGGDATLRTARNVVDGRRDAAAMLAGSTGGGPMPHSGEGLGFFQAVFFNFVHMFSTAPGTSSIVMFASMIFAPFAGNVVDRVGKRTTLMVLGSLLMIPAYLMLALTMLPPAIPMIVLERLS